jgi:hypothetical protein
MLELYRKGSATDGGLLQPLANAGWRAAAFEWRLHEDADSIRALWAETARALTEGFVRKRAGFEQTAEQLLLAVHFSIAARNFDLVGSLTHLIPAMSLSSRAHRLARSPLLLLEGYVSIVRAIVERKREHAATAECLLEEARAESESDWWRQQFPSGREATWKLNEHEATRGLLRVVAGLVSQQNLQWEHDQLSAAELDQPEWAQFTDLMDGVLLRLEQFMETELNHRPKLYFWLPGIALSVLAENAGLRLDWLRARQQQKGYDRLPFKLVYQ